jgi:type I restriction enzyme S subunit
MDAATAALFPDHFQDSELGQIPNGWEVGSVYEICSVTYGAPFASKLFNSSMDGRPLIRIRDLPGECPGVWTEEVHPKGYLVQPGDIVVGMDGEFRAYLWGGEEAWLNQRVCVFAPKNGFSPAFVRNSIVSPLAQVEATEIATTVIHLGKNDIDRFRVVIPDHQISKAFTHFCQPLYDHIVACKQESRDLATLRDTLLPKLLSGEITVPVAKKLIAATT